MLPTVRDLRPFHGQDTIGLKSGSVVIIVLMVVLGAAGWGLYLRPTSEHDPRSIERMALQLGDWRGLDIPISEGVERILRADSQVQRAYERVPGEIVLLYVGYYGTKRGGRPEHTPWMCYPAAGWLILSSLERPLLDSHGSVDGAQMVEFVVAKGGEQELVHFWYATHRSAGLATETALTLDHVRGLLSRARRADGALVRISTPIDGSGIEAARRRLQDFTTPLSGELRSSWPVAS